MALWKSDAVLIDLSCFSICPDPESVVVPVVVRGNVRGQAGRIIIWVDPMECDGLI